MPCFLYPFDFVDDIWSHNFHNAIQSHSFEKGVIYLQHQDAHNM